jgi:hypothetical protein
MNDAITTLLLHELACYFGIRRERSPTARMTPSPTAVAAPFSVADNSRTGRLKAFAWPARPRRCGNS